MAVALGCLGLFCGSVAKAQTEPEAHRNTDDFGVDLSSGTFNLKITPVTGGSASTSIDLTRVWGQSGWKDGYAGHLRQSSSSAITIVRGSVSESFTKSGSVWVPSKANGATLVKGPELRFPSYTYTASDGTVIVYHSVGTDVRTMEDNYPKKFTVIGSDQCRIHTTQRVDLATEQCAVPVSITEPSGRTLTLSWQEEGDCDFYDNGPQDQGYQCNNRTRLVSVSDSMGYTASYSYAVEFYDYGSGWWRRTAESLTDLSTNATTSASFAEPSAGTQQITDQHGGVWTFTFDGSNRMTSVTRPGHSSPSITIAYGGDGKVSSVTKDGVTKTYSWSTSGSDTVVAVNGGASGSGTVTTSPSAGQPGTVTNAVNASVVNEYDSSQRLSKTTWPEGNYVQYTRDARGNITNTLIVPKPSSGQSSISTSADYDVTCSNLKKCDKPNFTIDGKGNRTDYTYDPTHGQLTRVQLPAPASGQPRPQVDYSYTALTAPGQPGSEYKLTQITSCATAATCPGSASETRVTIAYNTPNLQTSSVTVASGNGAISSTTTYAYDANDNLASVDGPLAGADDTEYFFYDTGRRPVGAIGPDPDGTGSAQRPANRATYDAAGRIWKVETGITPHATQGYLDAMTVLRTVETTFDANGRKTVEKLKGSDGVVAQLVQYSYDAAGRLECTALRMNPAAFGSLPASACSLGTPGSFGPDRITKLYYDATGRPERQESGVGTAEVGNDAVTTYTLNGQVYTATDGENNKTTYEYDGFDRLAKLRLPVTTQGAGSSSTGDYEQYAHDANGNVVTRRTRAGETLTFVYDALDRLTTKIVPERSGLSSTHTRDVHYGYDLMGRPSYARFDSASGEGLAYVYDALGRMTSETQTMDGVARTLTSAYDTASARTTLTHPDWHQINYYRNTGSGLYYAAINSNPLFYPPYNADGSLNWLYRWQSSIANWSGDAATDLNFDALGRLSSIGQHLSGNSFDSTTTLSFNPASQIASTTRSNDAYAWTGAANFDRAYTANGLNQYNTVAGMGFGYDANGNLTSDGTYTFTYDVENRMVATGSGSTSATLRYDPLGRLYEVSGSATGITRFVHDGSDLVAEYDAGGNLLRRYVHGADETYDDPLVWFEGAGVSDAARRYLYADERGSVVAVTDANGNALAINAYDEYGIPKSGNQGRFQYTGQAWIPELGLYYYKARMYSPTLGRFMQTDPIGYADGMNMYDYVGGDPINGVDPSGRCTIVTWTKWLFYPSTGEKKKVSTWVEKSGVCEFEDKVTTIVVTAVRGKKDKPKRPPPRVCFGPPQGPPGVSASDLARETRRNGDIASKRSPSDLAWFRDQVRNKAPWDYKQYNRAYQAYGNYNYGYAGTRQGIPASVLRAGAAYAQVRAGTSDWSFAPTAFDDPKDREQIDRGIHDALNGCL
ncbi:RHS repeat-associated core domain-containing protein [Qipengyuania sediminis]|uniref:RHS repeat-associated core domain-containing protein n=1 Tax=Qipengyuania sediminis TaxID=1532023 RepID=UPI001404D2BF|nr:RHS repeat-associated core domain-containing protein [Qipengyuania sediminis]